MLAARCQAAQRTPSSTTTSRPARSHRQQRRRRMPVPSAGTAANGVAAAAAASPAHDEPLFRFGLLSDLQHADRENGASFHGALQAVVAASGPSSALHPAPCAGLLKTRRSRRAQPTSRDWMHAGQACHCLGFRPASALHHDGPCPHPLPRRRYPAVLPLRAAAAGPGRGCDAGCGLLLCGAPGRHSGLPQLAGQWVEQDGGEGRRYAAAACLRAPSRR